MLPSRDLNPDFRVQSAACYPPAIASSGVAGWPLDNARESGFEPELQRPERCVLPLDDSLMLKLLYILNLPINLSIYPAFAESYHVVASLLLLSVQTIPQRCQRNSPNRTILARSWVKNLPLKDSPCEVSRFFAASKVFGKFHLFYLSTHCENPPRQSFLCPLPRFCLPF
jgi:hypothetical protein